MPAGGTYPTAAAIDIAGTYLYVTYTYQNGFGPNSPGPGGVAIFPINSDGSLGTPTNVNVGNDPIAVAASAPTCTATPALGNNSSPNCIILGSGSTANNGTNQSFVYVVDAETAAAQATVLGFVENPATGALTPIAGTNPKGGFGAGVFPSAIAIEPTGKYVYITDKAQNQIYGYGIANNTTGALTGLNTGPFATGQFPMGITIEPRGKYVYVANYNSQTVSSYSLNLSNGSLGASAGSNFTTTTGPTCVTVEPALGIYLYTLGLPEFLHLRRSAEPEHWSAFRSRNVVLPLGLATCLRVSVPNGPHASQSTQPSTSKAIRTKQKSPANGRALLFEMTGCVLTGLSPGDH